MFSALFPCFCRSQSGRQCYFGVVARAGIQPSTQREGDVDCFVQYPKRMHSSTPPSAATIASATASTAAVPSFSLAFNGTVNAGVIRPKGMQGKLNAKVAKIQIMWHKPNNPQRERQKGGPLMHVRITG